MGCNKCAYIHLSEHSKEMSRLRHYHVALQIVQQGDGGDQRYQLQRLVHNQIVNLNED